MSFVLSVIIFLFGLAVGSFLNVAILRLRSGQVCRLETDEKIIKGRSRCPKCGRVLHWYDLVPVLSFLWLRGKCRYCRRLISWQYPIIEITTALLFLLVFNFSPFGRPPAGWQISNLATFCYLLYVTCSLIVIFVYDLKRYIIPDKIIFPAIIISVVYRFFEVSDLFGHWSLVIGHFLPYLLSALGAAAFFAAIIILTRGRGMGWGDVKLAFLMGLILGWPGIFLALLLAFLSGALTGVGLIIAGRKQLKSQIPFGPFLAGATIFALFFGEPLANWYFTFLRL